MRIVYEFLFLEFCVLLFTHAYVTLNHVVQCNERIPSISCRTGKQHQDYFTHYRSCVSQFTMATTNHYGYDHVTDAIAPQTNLEPASSDPSAYDSKTGSSHPVGFQPSNYSVVCGRGKESFNHVGNRHFRFLTSTFIERYSRADSKAAKSAIVSEIITMIRQADGNFCKFQSGAWFEVGDHHAREKVSALLRDLLHTQYRSSAKAKIARRKTKTQKKKQSKNAVSSQKVVDHSSTSSSCWESSKVSLEFDHSLETDLFAI
jgi:hypothetical protein